MIPIYQPAELLPATLKIQNGRRDELAQLWNLIRGHMSLVGPAEKPRFVAGSLRCAESLQGQFRCHG